MIVISFKTINNYPIHELIMKKYQKNSVLLLCIKNKITAEVLEFQLLRVSIGLKRSYFNPIQLFICLIIFDSIQIGLILKLNR